MAKLRDDEVLAICQAEIAGLARLPQWQAGAGPAEGAAILQRRALWERDRRLEPDRHHRSARYGGIDHAEPD